MEIHMANVKTDVNKNMYSQMDKYLDDTSKQIKQFSRGDIVEGTVVDIRDGLIIVDVGYKSEGIVAGRELKSDTLDWTKLTLGEKVLVYVLNQKMMRDN